MLADKVFRSISVVLCKCKEQADGCSLSRFRLGVYEVGALWAISKLKPEFVVVGLVCL